MFLEAQQNPDEDIERVLDDGYIRIRVNSMSKTVTISGITRDVTWSMDIPGQPDVEIVDRVARSIVQSVRENVFLYPTEPDGVARSPQIARG